MVEEYKLPYSGSEINRRLRDVDTKAIIETVTMDEYNAIEEPNANTLYLIKDSEDGSLSHPFILEEDIDYGTEYPTEAVEGQLFLLEDTAPADFIVSQGITDGWTWRKWNSGIVECLGMPTVQSGAWTSIGTSGLHYTASPRSISLPQNLFNSIRTANVNVSAAAGAVVSPMTCSCSTSGLGIHFLRVLGGTNDVKLYLSIRVVGSWK
jgi:hypothetical protein